MPTPTPPPAAGRPARTSAEPDAEGPRASRGRRWAWIAIAVLAAGVLLLGGQKLSGFVQDFARWVGSLGAWGPAVFVVGYALAAVAFVSGAALTLAAGALFGLVEGTACAFAGAVLGSSAAFLIARHGGRAFVERRIRSDARFAAVDRAIARQGRRIVFLLRLSPAFPFVLLNYALGLTRVGFGDYLLASLGMLPGTLLYVYYGAVAGEVARLATAETVERGTAYYATLGVGLLATVVVTTLVTRLARRALREATDGEILEDPDADADA